MPKKHTKIYMKYFDIGETDIILCERCGSVAVDIHHIEPKGMGGSKTKDYIENLIALCRNCHDCAHNGVLSKDWLKAVHLEYMKL